MQANHRLYLVMEYCSGGDLSQHIRRLSRLPEGAARALMRQLAAGLREMWQHQLVHVSEGSWKG
jgi:serine/threonine protein kinase